MNKEHNKLSQHHPYIWKQFHIKETCTANLLSRYNLADNYRLTINYCYTLGKRWQNSTQEFGAISRCTESKTS